MSKCGDCDYYGAPIDENGIPLVISEVTGAKEAVDTTVKAACYYNAPYPNCGKSGRMTRPVVFYKEKACSKFKERV